MRDIGGHCPALSRDIGRGTDRDISLFRDMSEMTSKPEDKQKGKMMISNTSRKNIADFFTWEPGRISKALFSPVTNYRSGTDPIGFYSAENKPNEQIAEGEYRFKATYYQGDTQKVWIGQKVNNPTHKEAFFEFMKFLYETKDFHIYYEGVGSINEKHKLIDILAGS